MNSKPYIVGIAGGSASGKTSFINDLKNEFPLGKVTIVSQDNYYHPKEKQLIDENGKINFDLPESIDRASFHADVLKLMGNKSIQLKEYTFNVSPENAKSIMVKPASIIILEGLFVFHYEEIRKLIDLRVYIDVRDSIKLERRIKRDIKERGYPEDDVKYQWEHHVMPSYKRYLRPYRDDAHIIITNNHHYTKGLQVLCNHLRTKIG
ncbi:MAG: uridine kinase [Crocinitomicaceae bacterium]|nr:uridine kinase [Crocinitomicaceae bacterium]|tara:strand:- start:907 stop:1527 length:621 start_codon:yes stop_codon:yes gene_type:complete